MEKDKKEKKLSMMEAKFVDEYLICFKPMKSAIAAGYSAKTASQQAYNVLQRQHVKDEIERRIELEAVGRNERLMILSKIARNGEKDSDRIAAVERLGKLAGDYTKKIEHSGDVKMKVVDINYGLNDSD